MAQKRVLAILACGGDMQRAVLAGAADWLQRSRADWRVELRELPPDAVAPALRAWRGDGAICNQLPQWRGGWLARLPFPCVNCMGWVEEPQLPSVLGDDGAIGAACAEHLLERGFRHLVVIGAGSGGYTRRRAEGALRAAAYAGATARLQAWRDDLRPREAPEPVGYICINDQLAANWIARLHQAGIRLPEEAAVVGINNDALICGLRQPGISSCDIDFHRRGREAASLLERLMAGAPLPARAIRIPPRGVVQRASSETLAAGDPVIERAWRFLRERSHRPVGIDELVLAAGVSRRTLEQRVKMRFGFGLAEAVWRAHVDRAKRLLQSSDDSLLGIALDSGFQSASAFSTIFKRHTGHTPRAWRQRWR